MRTLVSNFANIGAKVTGLDAQRKVLADAINFDLKLSRIYTDIAKGNEGALSSGVTVLGEKASNGITFDQVKAYLVGHKYVTEGDTPILDDLAGRVYEVFHSNMPDMDVGYQMIFQDLDLRQSKQSSFELVDTNAGATWTQKKPGEATKVRRAITEASTTVKYLTFASGLGILDDWIRYQQWWTIEDAVAEQRAGGLDKRAEIHYGLLTALGAGVNEAFDTDDTKTLNNAAATILRAVRKKGYGTSQNAGFVIACAPEKVGRITKMLTANSGSLIVAYNANVQPITVRIRAVVSTTHIPAADNNYYLVLPGRKLKSGTWMDQQIERIRDGYKRAEDMVATMQFNAVVGDSDQVRRVAFV